MRFFSLRLSCNDNVKSWSWNWSSLSCMVAHPVVFRGSDPDPFSFLTVGSGSGLFLEVKRFASGSFRRDYLYSIFYVPSFFLWKWISIYSTWFQCRTRLIWCTYYCFGLRSTQNVDWPGVDSRPSLQLNVRFNNSIYCLTMLNPNFTKPANIPQQILFHQF